MAWGTFHESRRLSSGTESPNRCVLLDGSLYLLIRGEDVALNCTHVKGFDNCSDVLRSRTCELNPYREFKFLI